MNCGGRLWDSARRAIPFVVAKCDLKGGGCVAKDIVVYGAVDDSDIVIVRGLRVMLDARVAEAFGTETRQVNQAVSRNREKFSEESSATAAVHAK